MYYDTHHVYQKVNIHFIYFGALKKVRLGPYHIKGSLNWIEGRGRGWELGGGAGRGCEFI